MFILCISTLTVADPGFPIGGANLFLANFSRKLHKNDDILGRGVRPSRPLDPPMPFINIPIDT